VPFLESLLYNGHREEVLSLRPGLTGIGRSNAGSTTDYDERVEMDLLLREE